MTHFLLNESTGYYDPIGPITSETIIDQAKCILVAQLRRESLTELTSPDIVKDYLTLHLGSLEREVFACMFLDNRHRLIEYEELFFGTIDGASIHPREIVKASLLHNAAAVILAHNHPSGVAEPSKADQQITRRLQEALGLVDIRVLDHIVVGNGETVSFAERGLV